MGYVIFHVFIVFFAIIGLIEAVHLLATFFLKCNKSKSVLILCPNSQDIEFELRSLVSKIKWPGNLRPQKIYCIPKDLNEESKEIGKLLCKEYNFIDIVEISELSKLLDEI